MKSFFAFALLAGLALAGPTSFYGWKPHKEFVYLFETEQLASIPSIKDQYGGLKLRSTVKVQTFRDFSLRIEFLDPKFVTVNQVLPMGRDGKPMTPKPEMEIPGELRRYLVSPFEVHHKAGVIESIFVERSEPVIITNLKKAFLSQIQMDLAGLGRTLKASGNPEMPPLDGGDFEGLEGQQRLSNHGGSYFRTEETTISGKCQTSYTVTPLPKFQGNEIEEGLYDSLEQLKQEKAEILGSYSGSESVERLCQGKKWWRIQRVKNFENCKQRPIFQNNMGIKSTCDSTKETCRDRFTYGSSTSFIVCGDNLEEFYIRKVTGLSGGVNNPLGWNVTPEKLRSEAKVTLSLLHVHSEFSPMQKPSNPKQKNSLIFEYPLGGPFSSRGTQDLEQRMSESGSFVNGEQFEPILPMPDMTSKPLNVIPTFLSTEQIETQVLRLFNKVVNEVFKSPQSCSSSSDVAGTISSIVQSIRSFSLNELRNLNQKIKSECGSGPMGKVGRQIWGDLLSQVGTNPAIKLISEEFEEHKFSWSINVMQNTIRGVKTPTKQVFETLFQMIKRSEGRSRSFSEKRIFNTGIVSLSNLLFRACVHPETSINDFPVRFYGRFCSVESRFIRETFIPYLAEKIESQSTELPEKLVLISALGKIGHVKAIKPLTQVIEGKWVRGSLPRSLAVYSLKRMGRIEPTLVRPILNLLINNVAENPQVRIAAVATLPWTQPSTAELQKMATRTWFEPSKQVAGFIHSMMKDLTETVIPELKPVGLKAKTLLSLVKRSEWGIQYSGSKISNKFVEYLKTASSVETSYVDDEHGVGPARVSLNAKLFGGSWEIQGLSFTAYSQGMDKLYDIIQNTLGYQGHASQEVRDKLESISRKLHMSSNRRDRSFEGLVQMRVLDMEQTLAVGSNDLSGLVSEVIEAVFSAENQLSTSFDLVHAVTAISSETFAPSESGFPIYVQRIVPVVVGAKGHVNGHLDGYSGGEIDLEVVPVFNGKVETNFGVICPFSKQFLGVGVVMSLHASLPIEVSGSASLKGQLVLKVKTPEQIRQNMEFFHVYVKPYTVGKNLQKIGPISKSESVKMIIGSAGGQPKKFDWKIGQSLGLESEIKVETDVGIFDFAGLWNKIRQHNFGSLWNTAGMTPTIRYTSLKMEYNPSSSQAREWETSIDYTWGKKGGNVRPSVEEIESSGQRDLTSRICGRSENRELCIETETERVELHKKAVRKVEHMLSEMKSGISGISGGVSGGIGGKGGVAGGLAIHNVIKMKSGNSKALKIVVVGGTQEERLGKFHTKLDVDIKPYEGTPVGARIENELSMPSVPIRWGIQNLVELPIEMDSETTIDLFKGSMSERVHIKSEWKKSEELKSSIRSGLLRHCQGLAQERRGLSSECEETRHLASSVDKVKNTITFPEQWKKATFGTKTLNALKVWVWPSLYINHFKSGSGNQLVLESRVRADGNSAEIVIDTPWINANIENLRIRGPFKGYMPLSLRNGITTRVLQYLSRDQVPASCRLDSRKFHTFDNRTYDFEVNKCNHVVLKDCSEGEKRPLGVLLRTLSLESQEKEVTFLAGEFTTKITRSGVEVNGQRVEVPRRQIVVKRDSRGRIGLEIRLSDDGVFSVKSLIEAVEVITDGKRLEVIAPQTLKHKSCGLCGDLNGEDTTDLKTPGKCVMSTSRLAAYSWMIKEHNCGDIPERYRSQYQTDLRECRRPHEIPTKMEKVLRQLVRGGEGHRGHGLGNGKKPVGKTHLYEDQIQKSTICISKKQVNICPDGSEPLKVKEEQMSFSCVSKHTSWGHSLLQRVKAGETVKIELSSLPTAFVKTVVQPLVCKGPHGKITPRI